MCSQRNRRGRKKEEGTGPGGKKHKCRSKKNRKSFKGLNQEGQQLLGLLVGKRERLKWGPGKR